MCWLSTDSPRAYDGGKDHIAFPLEAAETLVDAGRDIASRGAQGNEQNHGAGHQSATIGGRQETQTSECQCNH